MCFPQLDNEVYKVLLTMIMKYSKNDVVAWKLHILA